MPERQRTLSPYVLRFSKYPVEIECNEMYLDGWNDLESRIFSGSGTLSIKGNSEFLFAMNAQPRDMVQALKAINASSMDPYNPHTAFRLRCTEYGGTEWNCGWVRPRVGMADGNQWQLSGYFSALNAFVKQQTPISGVELVYSGISGIPFSEHLTTPHQVSAIDLGPRVTGGRHRCQIFDSQIEAFTDEWSEHLWVIATTCTELNHPYLENWLSEPFRALRGELVYPKLAARNFSDGRAFVSIRQHPDLQGPYGGCVTQFNGYSPKAYWKFFEHYLRYIANYRTANGDHEFEANPLTRFHDEVIQARLTNSPWLLALTAASAIEGICKLDPEFSKQPADYSDEILEPLTTFCESILDQGFRSRVMSFTSSLKVPSPARYLNGLANRGLIKPDQVKAWKAVRNRVAHGNLFEPWTTESEDQQLRKLIELFYRLTMVRIEF